MALVVADRVRDTTTTTGTGAVTVAAAAPTRHRTFSAVCTTNDTLPYFIEHRSADEWEVGLGTYSASNQITRTTVLSSSNSGSAVSFSAGTKDVVLGIPARHAFAREKLQANTTFYVRADGSNDNPGRANTSGGAWLTITYAYEWICSNLDLAGYTVTIQVADGTYGAGLASTMIATGPILIQGNTTTPSNVVISAAGHLFSLFNANPFRVSVRGFKVVSTGASAFNLTVKGSQLGFGNIEFGACAEAHIYAVLGSAIYCEAVYTITGAALFHLYASTGSVVEIGNAGTINMTGTLAFVIFAFCSDYGIMRVYSTSYTGGTITGKRYEVDNAKINVFGGGANVFPGDSAGSGSIYA